MSILHRYRMDGWGIRKVIVNPTSNDNLPEPSVAGHSFTESINILNRELDKARAKLGSSNSISEGASAKAELSEIEEALGFMLGNRAK